MMYGLSACHPCTDFCVRNDQSSHFSFGVNTSVHQVPCPYHAILKNISVRSNLSNPVVNPSLRSHVFSVCTSSVAQSVARDDEYEFWTSNGSQENARVDEGTEITNESLNLLEWPLICNQVAVFASTSMAADAARDGEIRIGESQEESEDLLHQTAEALSLSVSHKLDFSDITDIRGIVSKAASGEICSTRDLCLVKKTLASAQRLADRILAPDGDSESLTKKKMKKTKTTTGKDEWRSAGRSRVMPEPLPAVRSTPTSALGSIMADCDFCPHLRQELNRCVDPSLEILSDRASPALGSVRKSRRENMRALEDLLKVTAGRVMAAGGIDSVIVTKRRGARLCIAVRTTHRHLLPGGVVLDVSNTGATVFMEPHQTIELNNRETFLSVLEQEEERTVLKTLTARVLSAADEILNLCHSVTCLDLACARATHAKWLGAVRPAFHPRIDPHANPRADSDRASMSTESLSEQNFVIFMEGIRHPVLLGSALSRPPHPSSSSSGRDDHDHLARQPDLPIPIDVKVKSGVKAVVLSGPNTGGKTAALKTVGIAALMSKAGLFIPAQDPPLLPWFSRILASIGDNQSLQQNLSTFSGHIRQLCNILDSSDASALVLLDEIGGGTDPSEGAALATAVLQHLLTSVELTVATTHCMELKDLAIRDQRFENAALEFDTRTLRPTYRVLWGEAGESNALDIMEALDFDPAVVSKARGLLTQLTPTALRASQSELTIQLLQQLEQEKSSAEAAAFNFSQIQELHTELVLESSNLEERVKQLKYQNQRAINHEVAEAESRINRIVSEFQSSQDGRACTAEALSLRDAQAAISLIMEEYSAKYQAMLSGRGKTSDEAGESVTRLPQIGEKVIVRTLGKKQGIVTKSAKTCSDHLIVQVGMLNIRVKSNEVIPC